MIFLVDHDAQRLPAIHDHGAADTFGRVLATDQMALDQHLLLQRRKILQQLRKRILHFGKLLHARPDQLEHFDSRRLSCPIRETHGSADCAQAGRGC